MGLVRGPHRGHIASVQLTIWQFYFKPLWLWEAVMVAENSDFPTGGVPRAKGLQAACARMKIADDILHAFHFACDTKDFLVADSLLQVLESLLVKRVFEPPATQATELALFVAAHERLWTLRHTLEQ